MVQHMFFSLSQLWLYYKMRSQLCFSSFFFIFFLLPSISMPCPEILTISSNRTIVSPNNVFELGFFNIKKLSSLWYFGIWYKDDPKRTFLWVGNRDKPLVGSNGTLKFFDNNLILFDQDHIRVWSTNLNGGDMRFPMVAELLDNGNFVVKNSNNPDRYLWQSFDYPTDTLLPQMKLGRDPELGINKVLKSWITPNDPSSGAYSLEVKNQAGLLELFICMQESSNCVYRSDPWDGLRFGNMPPNIFKLDYIRSNCTGKAEDSLVMTGPKNSRLTLSTALELFTWVPETKQWKTTWSPFSDDCIVYDLCGPYGYCSTNTTRSCNCIKGFDIRSREDWKLGLWSGGCERRTPLSCDGDEFMVLKNMKLPDTKNATVDMKIGLEECDKRCRGDCNCTAFAYVGSLKSRQGCVTWTGKIYDMRNYTVGGQDLYVKIAAKET